MKRPLFSIRAQTFLAAFKSGVSSAAFTSYLGATRRAARKAAFLLFFLAALLAGGAATVHGQSAVDGFDPNANSIVRVVVVQPDGKILIGGDFTTVSPNGGAAITRMRPLPVILGLSAKRFCRRCFRV